MVRRRVSAVSNHEAAYGPASFETRSALLRMRIETLGILAGIALAFHQSIAAGRTP
jgi:hypothetical protein